jgi:hypothetical protein
MHCVPAEGCDVDTGSNETERTELSGLLNSLDRAWLMKRMFAAAAFVDPPLDIFLNVSQKFALSGPLLGIVLGFLTYGFLERLSRSPTDATASNVTMNASVKAVRRHGGRYIYGIEADR